MDENTKRSVGGWVVFESIVVLLVLGVGAYAFFQGRFEIAAIGVVACLVILLIGRAIFGASLWRPGR